MEFKLGDVVWTNEPTLEARDGSYSAPEPPREVKVTSLPGPEDRRPLVTVQAFDAETGAVDNDANATALVLPENLHRTEAEAQRAYAEELDDYINGLRAQIVTLRAARDNARRMASDCRLPAWINEIWLVAEARRPDGASLRLVERLEDPAALTDGPAAREAVLPVMIDLMRRLTPPVVRIAFGVAVVRQGGSEELMIGSYSANRGGIDLKECTTRPGRHVQGVLTALHAFVMQHDDEDAKADDPYGRGDRDLLQDVRALQAVTGMDNDELIQHALLMIDGHGLSRAFMDVLEDEEDDRDE